MRKTALVAGILYLLTFASSIAAVLLLAPALSNPNYITSAGADTQGASGSPSRRGQCPRVHRDRLAARKHLDRAGHYLHRRRAIAALLDYFFGKPFRSAS